MSSLLDALHVSPAAVRRRKAAVHQLCRDVLAPLSPKMTAGVRVVIQLLDGRRLDVSVSPRLHARDLLALAASHCCAVRDTRYFSLAHLAANGVPHWLSLDRRLWEHESLRSMTNRTVTIAFLVKFYPNSVSELRGAPEVELFYQHARRCLAKDQLGVDSDLAFQLAALALQASYGDFVDTFLTHSQLKKSSLLPTSVLRDHPSLLYCEERVAAEHRQLVGLSRGDAILRFMKEVESLPTYGIHYYDVKDRNDLPWYIGLSNRGISQYDYLDKRKPRRVFLWRQLENIYFRERKFSIEVLDPKRVCVSRRSLGSPSASVTVHVWFAESQALCKAIWSMAIAQHQFYLDRKALRSEEHNNTTCDMPELAVDLSRSCLSLSTHSSSSNLSRSGSHSSLHHHSHTESGSSESLEAARLEMLEALKLRKSGLQEKLSAKTEELRLLCLREGELTGELPPEYPLVPGQPPPAVRKRVGTSFALDETIINKIINKQEETVSALELECEIMAKITSAALKLANESTARKGVRRQRKLSYQQSARRLRELEQKLKQAKSKAVVTASTLPKQKKKPRPLSDSEGIEDSGITGSLSSSAGSGQESPRDMPPLHCPHASPSLNNTLTPHDSSDTVRAQRDRSPHRTRGSAPASPYRSAASVSSSTSSSGGGGGDAVGSVHNTTMTSSSSSRPSSPSRPSRPHSADRRRGNSASRAEIGRQLHDTPDHVTACHLLDGALLNYHPQYHHHSGTPRVPEHFNSSNHLSPQAGVASRPNHHYNAQHQVRRNTSGSKLRHSSSSATPTPHNTSASSLSSSHLHNTTSSSLNSTASGANYPTPHRQSMYASQFGANAHHGFQNSYHDHRSYYPPGVSIPQNDHSPMPPLSVTHRRDPSRSATQAIFYNPQNATNGFAISPSHQSYNPSQAQREILAKISQANTPPPSSSRPPQSCDGGEQINNDVGAVTEGGFENRPHSDDVPGGQQSSLAQHSQARPLVQNYANSSISLREKYSNQSGHNEIDDGNPETIHTLVRTASGRSYMETTFLGDSSSASSTTSNQENIPPVKRVAPSDQLLPLKPTSHLRASASVTPADLASPRLLPASDLVPLRATKSSSELPPLKATNPRSDHGLLNASNKGEPLISLAEAAQLKKDREREWYETCLDSPSSNRKLQKSAVAEIVVSKLPGLSSANSTVASSNSDVSSTGTATGVPVDSSSERNQSMVISTGTYQPSREVSKPFEMSDFYKYSTKYRKHSLANCSGLSSSNSSFSNGTDSNPMSPVLPPRAQVVVSSNKGAPPSPNVIAKHSTPSAQQKGVYQSPAPFSCQGVTNQSSSGSPGPPGTPNTPSWEGAPLHQAVPATVTNKRSATLV